MLFSSIELVNGVGSDKWNTKFSKYTSPPNWPKLTTATFLIPSPKPYRLKLKLLNCLPKYLWASYWDLQPRIWCSGSADFWNFDFPHFPTSSEKKIVSKCQINLSQAQFISYIILCDDLSLEHLWNMRKWPRLKMTSNCAIKSACLSEISFHLFRVKLKLLKTLPNFSFQTDINV